MSGIGKDFKVKDSINVGLSGYFDAGIKIGAAPYTGIENSGPAIDAWGAILSGGRDLSTVIGDSIVEMAPGTEQSYLQYIRQEDQNFDNTNPPLDWTESVKVYGLDTGDSPTFAGLALSGTTGTAVISAAQTLVLDPGGYGNTNLGPGGVVRVKGDLYVDGTTTTINSSTISLSDTLITLGYNHDGTTEQKLSDASALPAGGAGIEIGSIAGATILYHTTAHTNEWYFGSGVNVNGSLSGNDGLTIQSGATNLGGSLTVTGATVLNSTLKVASDTTIDGNTTLSGDFTIHAENDQSDVQFSVTQATGNTTVGGTLDVTSNTTVGGTLDVTNSTTLGDTLTVQGNTTLSGDLAIHQENTDTVTFSVAQDTGNTTVGGTLDVTSNTTVGGTLGVTGTTTLTDDLTANGEAHFTSTTTVSGDLLVKQSGTDTTKLTISNDTGTITTYGSVSAQTDLHVDGDTTLANAIVEDLAPTGGDADKVVKATTGGRLTKSIITDDGSKATITGELSATNTATLDNGLTAKGEIALESADGITKAFTYAGLTGTTTSNALIDTLDITDAAGNECNAAKFIVSVDNGSDGKTVIEVVAAVAANGTVSGTAYGQVDTVDTEPPLLDINIQANSGKIAIGVQGANNPGSGYVATADIPVVIFATGFYN